MKIALLDSGVSTRINLQQVEYVNTKLYQIDPKDNIGHGTAIAYILDKKIKNCCIVSYKLFDTDYTTDEDSIINALNDINRRKDIKLIHISCGVTYACNIEKFREICNELCNRKIFIISAYDNGGSISYPAAFENTIGVYWDKTVKNTNEYYYLDNSEVDILGYAGTMRLPWGEEGYKYVAGSSFAAPLITGKVASIVSENKEASLNQIKSKLKVGAAKVLKYPIQSVDNQQVNLTNIVKKMKKVIIFPCNKEMHALIGNADLLSFDIVGIFDHKNSRMIGKNTLNVIYGKYTKSIRIEEFDNIEWENEFDTIIVGHLGLINSLYQYNFTEKILRLCIQHNKNAYFLDGIEKHKELISQKRNGFIVSHHIKNLNISKFSCGGFHKLASPVLMVVGTSDKQGKFHLQLALRRYFLEDGYNIGQIGTEPTSHLFGMNVTFSNGYNNSYDLGDEEEIKYINEVAFQMGYKDIIIGGIQSNTIPLDFGNSGFLSIHQNNILTALMPDGVILVVNPNDEVSYIQRTITFLETYYETSVIAIVIYPRYRINTWNINNVIDKEMTLKEKKDIQKNFKRIFDRPTYIGEENMKELYEECIKFYAEGK